MPAELNFTAPSDATTRLKTLGKGDLLSFLRKLPWSFIQSLIQSTADFDHLDLACRILDALPDEFDDVFDEVTNTPVEQVLKIVRMVYCHVDGANRTAYQIIGNCVRNWSSFANESSGKTAVAEVLDPIFAKERKFAAVRRLAFFLDVIGVRPSSDTAEKFCKRNARKNQLVSRLFSFWKSQIPITTVTGFVGRLFPEDPAGRPCVFKEHWTEGLVKDLESSDAQHLASFFFPSESLSP